MLLLNFSHPLTDAQRSQIETLAGQPITDLRTLPLQFDEQQPFAPQVRTLVAAIDLSPAAWQTTPMLVLLPSLNFITAALLAELHGRMGYFPPMVRTRPVAESVPRRFEVAEILDLQAIREDARTQR